MTNKKILYVSFHDLYNSKEGVSKKISAQIKAFRKLGMTVDYTWRNQEYVFLNKKKIFPRLGKGRNDIKKLYDHLDTININYEYIYIRYESTVLSKIKFLKSAKKNGAKILLEIPTYPYKGEFKGTGAKIKYYVREAYNYFLRNEVDYIVTYSDDSTILGIPCINISNGIDLDNMKLIEKIEEDALIFTSVSICAHWHGIDRFLNSLDQYLERNLAKKIKFNIVGEGAETPKLKQIVSKSKYLDDVVIFQGFKSGEELDAIYNETDIGVGCLGNHRKGIYTIQALKNKEYAAKGLPMIFSEDDPGLRGKEYVYRATHDEQLIDISDLIQWYQKLTITPEEIRESIKEFSWENQMKKVIDKITELE